MGRHDAAPDRPAFKVPEASEPTNEVDMDEFEAEFAEPTQETEAPTPENPADNNVAAAEQRIDTLMLTGARRWNTIKNGSSETLKTAKERVSGLGRSIVGKWNKLKTSAARGAKANFYRALGAGEVGVVKATELGRNAAANLAARRDIALEKAAQKAREKSQNEAYASYEDNIDYSTAHEEALDQNDKRANDDAAYDSYAENIDATNKRESQESAYDSYDGNVAATKAREVYEQRAHEAMLLLRAANIAKIRRQMARQEAWKSVKGYATEKTSKGLERTSDAYKKAKGRLKSIGSAIGGAAKRAGHFAKRTIDVASASTGAAVTTAKETWKATANVPNTSETASERFEE